MLELNEISKVLQRMGTDSAVLTDSRVAHVVASGLDLLSQREIPGVTIRSERIGDRLTAQITVKQSAKIESPVHLCMGVLHAAGRQHIQVQVKLEQDSAAKIVAHCFFPRARKVEHIMDATIEIDRAPNFAMPKGIIMAPSVV